MLGFTAYTARQMTLEHKALIDGLNDVFIAIMTPPDVKENLPPFLKKKLTDKTIERANERLSKGTPP